MKNSYWNKTGKYQALYDELAKLIPYRGECDNPELDLLRLVSNAYYDVYNNGACNSYPFKQLLNVINNYKDKLVNYTSYSDTEYAQLISWLTFASTDDGYIDLDGDEQIVDLIERLVDAAILIANDDK